MRTVRPVKIKELHDLFSYDEKTGVLSWRVRRWRVSPGDVAGSKDLLGYLTIRVFGKSYKVHRIAWAMTYGRWPKVNLDHINGDGRDNRLCNLREADQSQNLLNTRLNVRNVSGHKNVFWNSAYQRWQVVIRFRGKDRKFGLFHDLEKAAQAAHGARETVAKEFACCGIKPTQSLNLRVKRKARP